MHLNELTSYLLPFSRQLCIHLTPRVIKIGQNGCQLLFCEKRKRFVLFKGDKRQKKENGVRESKKGLVPVAPTLCPCCGAAVGTGK